MREVTSMNNVLTQLKEELEFSEKEMKLIELEEEAIKKVVEKAESESVNNKE